MLTPTASPIPVRKKSPLSAVLISLVLLAGSTVPLGAQDLLSLRALLKAERSREAIQGAQKLVKRESGNAEAWFLLSEAHLMEGDLKSGREALNKALKLDSSLRQGWLNRAALDMAEQRFEGAIEAFRTAQSLDPSATDSYLNIGTALLLSGNLPEGEASFKTYITRTPRDGDAHFLVASNLALAGYRAKSAEYLQQSIELNERNRLRVRTDPNFNEASAAPEIQDLLLNDRYQPPPGSLNAANVFEVPYTGTTSKVLYAVVDVLQLGGYPVEQQVEVTPEWAVLWSDVRVKILARGRTHSEVQLIAPPGSHLPAAWQARTDKFFREVAVQLVGRS